jgi:hypothetical protein
VITVNLPDTMIEFYSILEKVLTQNGLNESIPDIKSHILSKRLPLDTLKSMIQKNGFRVTHAIESEFSFKYNDANSMFSHFLISLAFLDSWKKLVPENLRVKIFQEIEIQIDEIADANSGFSLTIPFVTMNCMKQ